MSNSNNSGNNSGGHQLTWNPGTSNWIPINPGMGQWITVTVPQQQTLPGMHQQYCTEEVPAAEEKKKDSDGCTCKKCKEYFPYAEPNQEDGSLVCYGCRLEW